MYEHVCKQARQDYCCETNTKHKHQYINRSIHTLCSLKKKKKAHCMGKAVTQVARKHSLFAESSIVWVALDVFLQWFLIINRWCQRFGGLSVWQGISINTDFLSISVCSTLLTFNYRCGDVCNLCIRVWGEPQGNSLTGRPVILLRDEFCKLPLKTDERRKRVWNGLKCFKRKSR